MRSLFLAVGLLLMPSAAFATGSSGITNNNTQGIQFNGAGITNSGTLTNNVNNGAINSHNTTTNKTVTTNSNNKTTVNSNNTTKSNNTNSFNRTSNTHNIDRSVHNTATGGTATSSATGGNATVGNTTATVGNTTSTATTGNQTLTGGNTTTGNQSITVEAPKRNAIAPNLGNLSNGPCSGVSGGVSLGLPGIGIGGQVGSVDGQCTLRYNIEVVSRFNPELAAEMVQDLEGVEAAQKRMVQRQTVTRPRTSGDTEVMQTVASKPSAPTDWSMMHTR